nr:hypothetical protein [Tanacetum cinerariifolium]
MSTVPTRITREISSGCTTTHYDISLPDYEAFYFDDDHIKEISSGSTTTHADISLPEYDSFIFEEFIDELAHIISPLEYDCFYFRDLPNPGELMSVLNFGIRENLSTTLVNIPIEDDHSPLLAYVVWIFVAYLTYPVIPPYLHPFGNEDTIFDPGITINHVYSFEPVSSHRHGAFKKFNTHRSHLNEWPMIINGLSHSSVILFLQCLILCSYFHPKIKKNPGSRSSNEETSPLFAYVVWIFLPFLTYPVAPPYLFSSENEDTNFDPDISIYHSFMPGVSHRSGTFMKFNVYPNHLNKSPL